MKLKFLYSRYFIYPVFLLTFLALYSVSMNVFGTSNGKSRLLVEDGVEKICKENEDLYNYYYKTEKYELEGGEDFGKMNDDSQIILDFLDDGFKTSYIFKYIWHTGKYVFFLILLILIIIVTLYYSIASCVRCCTEKCCDFFSFSCCKNKCCKKVICILIPFIYLVIFVLAIVAMATAALTVQKFSGTICVGLQLVDTFIEGEIRNVHPKWSGVFIVSDTLEKLGNMTSINNIDMVKTIDKNKLNYVQKYKEWITFLNNSNNKHLDNYFYIKDPKMSLTDEEKEIKLSPEHAYKWGPFNKTDTILNDIYSHDEEGVNKIDNIISVLENSLYSLLGCDYDEEGNIQCQDNTVISQAFKKGAEIINKIKDPISNIKTKITTPVQNIYDQVNSTIIGIFSVVMVFVILYCIIIELLLSVFCCSKKCKCIAGCLKWILCFIYYTSIFIVIIGFVVGIVIGVLGSLVKNMTQVVEYITSTDNLNSETPKIFGKSDYIKYLDVCLNGNGDMAAALGLTESCESIDNITEISEDTEDLKNETNFTSPMIDYYRYYLGNLTDTYLNTIFYNVNEKNEILYNIDEKIKEINKYVSGEYAENKEANCFINETWSKNNESDGYIYNSEYPIPDKTTRYLIYLYDKELDKANLENRYNNACPTNGHPYSKVSDASTSFNNLFKDIKTNILSDKFKQNYLNDLDELNRLFGEKNTYLLNILNDASSPIDNIEKTFTSYISGNENIFSFLNCKFVGENKLLLMNILYTSLGVYLDLFGTVTSILSLFIFIGIICILIVIKNTKLDSKEGASDLDLETLDDILKGNDTSDQISSSNGKTQELMNY